MAGVLAFAGSAAPRARASGAVQAILAPASFGEPSTAYPGAYSGVGVGIQADYYLNNLPWGITAGYLTEGNGQFEYVRAKYYLSGHPQPPRPSSRDAVQIEPRARGYYLELGIAPYQMSATTVSGSTTVQTSTSGVGAVGAVGVEQPLFWGLFLGVRADLLSSVGGSSSFNILIFEASVGLPIAF